MPTTAQRAGNFTGYADGNGNLYNLTDPSTGSPVPNNNLTPLLTEDPAGAVYGQAILNFFPLPNMCGTTYNHTGVASTGCIVDATASTTQYQRNYYYFAQETHPRRNDNLRFDLNLTSKLTTWVRYINDYDLDEAFGFPLQNSQGQWAPFGVNHPNPGHGYGVGITYTINPTTVNEFLFGKSYNSWDYYSADDSQVARSTMGNPPSFDNFTTDPNFVNDKTSTRPAGMGTGPIYYQIAVPNVSFGGDEPSEASISPCSAGGSQCPYTNWNDIYQFTDNLSKVWGKHNIKAGFYYERTGKVEWASGTQGNYVGSYNFGSSTAMPNNTQDGYGNAYLGQYQSYNEGGRAVVNVWYTDIEWFAQDNWRLSKKLTLDLGIRFTYQAPVSNLNDNTYAFVQAQYNAANAERLYFPYCTVSTAKGSCPTADNKAYDPKTGYLTFAALQGTFVPPAVGGYSGGTPTPFPGMVQSAPGTPLWPSTWTYKHSVVPALRIGFAYDVFGNGRTAIRGGFGEFINLTDSHFAQLEAGNPPDTVSRTIYYGNIDQVPNFANNAAITPASLNQTAGVQPMQSNYNGSFSIQQNIGFSTVLEAAYVVNLSKHIWAAYQLNAIGPYAEYAVGFNNPNVGYLPANTSGKELSDNYFRPKPGWSALAADALAENASYNSLQITARRNMTKHLSYGGAFTWGKNMSLGGGYPTSVSPYFPDKFRNYEPTYTPTPLVLVVNYVYEAPNLGQKLNSKLLGVVTDHWMISGITQIHSNLLTSIPGISFTNTTSSNPTMNWTGGYEGARMLVTGNWNLPAGTSSFAGNTPFTAAVGANVNGTAGNQMINETAFTIPWPCSATPGATPELGIGENPECYGNAGPGSLIQEPHTRLDNWDMTFTKNFPLKSERRVIQFRAEMYNIWNHTQFSGVSISPSYNWPNWQNGLYEQETSGLGRYTSTQNPRYMSMSLRFQF